MATPMEEQYPVICDWVRHKTVSTDALRAELQTALEMFAPESASDLRERLVKADAELKDLANHSHTEMDRQRRLAKAEGVRLALSYLDEYGRGA